MKARIIVDPLRDEEVVIYAHSESGWARAVLDFSRGADTELVGYSGGGRERLELQDVECFVSESGAIYAMLTNGERLEVKERLYELEERYGDALIRLSQSALANLAHVRRFDTSFAGTMIVEFKSGYRDYVSRRQMKAVKERILSK